MHVTCEIDSKSGARRALQSAQPLCEIDVFMLAASFFDNTSGAMTIYSLSSVCIYFTYIYIYIYILLYVYICILCDMYVYGLRAGLGLELIPLPWRDSLFAAFKDRRRCKSCCGSTVAHGAFVDGITQGTEGWHSAPILSM